MIPITKRQVEAWFKKLSQGQKKEFMELFTIGDPTSDVLRGYLKVMPATVITAAQNLSGKKGFPRLVEPSKKSKETLKKEDVAVVSPDPIATVSQDPTEPNGSKVSQVVQVVSTIKTAWEKFISWWNTVEQKK